MYGNFWRIAATHTHVVPRVAISLVFSEFSHEELIVEGESYSERSSVSIKFEDDGLSGTQTDWPSRPWNPYSVGWGDCANSSSLNWLACKTSTTPKDQTCVTLSLQLFLTRNLWADVNHYRDRNGLLSVCPILYEQCSVYVSVSSDEAMHVLCDGYFDAHWMIAVPL